MQNSMPLLEVKNLVKTFPVKGGFFGKTVGEVHALSGVSLFLGKGEIVGLVGESGCGKTTLGRTILKLTEPTDGKIIFHGKNITSYSAEQMRPLRREMQIVFQDPYASLNPRMTIGNAISEPLKVHKIVPRKELKEKVLELLSVVGLKEDAYYKYPHEFSGGQRQRIGIARALSVNPKLVVADEPVSALDVSIQAQIINLLSDLNQQFGLSLLFISHDLKVVRHISHRVMVMYLGRVMEVLDAGDLSEAKHPYTVSLLSAVPVADPKHKRKRIILAGDVPSPLNPPSGCVFHTRCPMAIERCKTEIPLLREAEKDNQVACHLV
ncbi:MAG: hypothetical protein A3G32_06425 [Deltaproteobacteria bacterium RIFCSPLOWO2_12_FULL_40_28]|nr:MAG: hypothetical protein A3C45_02520 [Deltaproteobacteria bacterium RIFCSPHIGHO2_02_FULL_40_28]OGQ19085.1 MAG: hypothetical protein A3E27_05610 [Deltaproteobacteria bacterium RIFCSPHIGHO2_12_FULL_40_32]OGQ40257.1 MAG: hypothetical protein A3I69_01050 [Deltaproteobacteria bacterium RIFCSPLOWO2_02_FULL_40_36]OGQ53528.1 MAG: hypothetical protein A3G32_06425 [Deltaproteobacteria bacterium RIFCSPLOWO2_12_FULL_40_28]